jgi:hypothetical protein
MARPPLKILAAASLLVATVAPGRTLQDSPARAAAVVAVPPAAAAHVNLAGVQPAAPVAAVPPPAAVHVNVTALRPVAYCQPLIVSRAAAIVHAAPPIAAAQVPHPQAGVPPAALVAHRPPVISQAAALAATTRPVDATTPEEPCIPRESPSDTAGTLPSVDLPPDPPPPPPPEPHCDGNICSTQQQVILPSLYVVINNSSKGFFCATQSAGSSFWSGWFKMMPGNEWNDQSPPQPKNVAFQCTSPVKRWIYVLQPGNRYSVQRNDEGIIQVVQVTVNP